LFGSLISDHLSEPWQYGENGEICVGVLYVSTFGMCVLGVFRGIPAGFGGGAGKWVWVWVWITHYWAGVFFSFSLGFGFGFGFWSGYIPLCYDITLLFTWWASQENLRLFMFSWLSIY
jgi:hypothetical protein